MSPVVSSGSLSVEPPPLELLAATPPKPPPPPPPRTVSTEPLGGMFCSQLDHPCVVFVVKEILCYERVMNDRSKAARVLTELEDGCVRAETLEWVIRGLRSPRGKRELAQRLHVLEFVGPQWGAPMYKTGNGVGRLLRGVAAKHEAGAKFVVCASSSSGNGATNVRMITDILSGPLVASNASTLDSAQRVQPVIDGEVPGLEDWVNTCGNLDDGCLLWVLVY